MVNNSKWSGLLEFNSIKTYLKGSINSKSAQIGKSITLKDKIESIKLSNYLSGVENFFAYSLYMKSKEEEKEGEGYPILFKSPSDIITHWKEIRDDDELIEKFKQMIEDYIVWLNSECINQRNKTKGLSGLTSEAYQAQFRGFLKRNNIKLNFRNYKSRSVKVKTQKKYGLKYEDLLEMGIKVIGYIKEPETKGLCKILLMTGLGGREIREITFGDIRYLNWEDEEVFIEGERIKTGVLFGNFFSGESKEFLQKWITKNEGKVDEDYIFGNQLISVYQKHQRIFRTAFNNMIRAEYPKLAEKLKVMKTKKDKKTKEVIEYEDIDTSFFTLHTLRGIFSTTCENKRVPKSVENYLIAHTNQNKLDDSYKFPSREVLLENYLVVINTIFGRKESGTIVQAKRQIISALIDAVSNDGKRKVQFMEYRNKDIHSLTTDIQTNILIQSIIEKTKTEVIEFISNNFTLTPK